jgi:xanthosine utilization system XapX-like protein
MIKSTKFSNLWNAFTLMGIILEYLSVTTRIPVQCLIIGIFDILIFIELLPWIFTLFRTILNLEEKIQQKAIFVK